MRSHFLRDKTSTSLNQDREKNIFGDPGASSRDDAMFSRKRYFRRESLLQELKSPWELILHTEPVAEVIEFRPADWPEKYISDQSARSFSHMTWFSPSIDLLGPRTAGRFSWRVSGKKI